MSPRERGNKNVIPPLSYRDCLANAREENLRESQTTQVSPQEHRTKSECLRSVLRQGRHARYALQEHHHIAKALICKPSVWLHHPRSGSGMASLGSTAEKYREMICENAKEQSRSLQGRRGRHPPAHCQASHPGGKRTYRNGMIMATNA